MMGCVPHAKQESEDIRLFLFVKFPNVFVCAHLAAVEMDFSVLDLRNDDHNGIPFA